MGNNLANNRSVLPESGYNRDKNIKSQSPSRWRSSSLPHKETENLRVSPETIEEEDISEDILTTKNRQKLKSAMKRPSQPAISVHLLQAGRLQAAAQQNSLAAPPSPRVTFAPRPGEAASQAEKIKGTAGAAGEQPQEGAAGVSASPVGSLDSHKEFDEYFEKAHRGLLSTIPSSLEEESRSERERSSSFTKANGITESTQSSHRNPGVEQDDNDTAKASERGEKEEKLRDNGKKTESPTNLQRNRAVSVTEEQIHLHHSYSTSELRRQSLFQRRQNNAVIASKMSIRKKKQSDGSKADANPRLTGPQITLIRQAWNQLSTTKGPSVLGNAVLQRLFFKAPLIKDSFLRSPLSNKEFSSHDKLLKEHTKMVSNLIDTLVKNLENLEGISTMLEGIGKRHAHLSEFGFTPKFWNIFAEAFIDCTLEWGEKSKRGEEVWKAWALIASFMIEKIKLGYIEERRNRAANAAPPGDASSQHPSRAARTPSSVSN